MRIYNASDEEALRTRKLLKEWAGEGFVTEAQYQLLRSETISDLRTTNVFLELVFFLFTLISVGGIAAFVLSVFLSWPSEQTAGIFFLIFGAACYAAAEIAVSRARLYRYGIEEALAVCSVGFLCAGMQAAFFSSSLYFSKSGGAEFLVPAAGAVLSLWIWHRFGLSYAFLAAMIFVVFVPGYWTSSHSAQHLILVAFYTIGLLCVVTLRDRHRFDYLDASFSLAEAFLWLGIYLAINLQLSSLSLLTRWWNGAQTASEFATPFYWATWVLIWCLPPIVLVHGIRQKDRSVIAVGAIAATLTLVSNKPYLGWPRHTWDPILLGILLSGVAIFIRRWLARGPSGIRHGFTAARLSEKDKHWIQVGATVLGSLPTSMTPNIHTNNPDFRFGGGQSGGGGAGGNF